MIGKKEIDFCEAHWMKKSDWAFAEEKNIH